ncbi:hypothetical protein C2E20_7174 [Micractinium conductrix]|uniref:Uncharacterized protein n=1 Tax=Micractinium conductrix TaxID=554055 RepID=A0A2P6V5R2_9CHLO|nr:hypothetical protein C2E20_7174 [Micractinium conductrix]|eukprot:PSC69423.1 hypothetical protein C2E20_7174 [Micractinium conductrix]
MGAVAQFITFGTGAVMSAVLLKSLDRVLYSLDETRDERLKAKDLHQRAVVEQQRMLAERAAIAAAVAQD